MPRLIFSLFMLACVATTVEARDFPGYYTTLQGDTVKCQFHFKDWEITPDYVTVYEGNNTSTLYPSQISGFGISGYGDYRSFEISYHQGNYSPLDAPDTFNESITTKHSFLKIMVRGKYTLYELMESSRPYYFVTKDDGPLTELKYRVKRVQMDLTRDEAYKKTLFDFFAAESLSYQYSNDITKSAYTLRDIAPLIRTLNEKVTGVKTVKKNRKLTQLELFAGGIDYQFSGAVDGMYSGPLNTFNGAQSISGGLNFQYFIPTNFRSIAVGASLGYSKYEGETSRTDSTKFYGSVNNYRNTNYNEQFKLQNSVLMLDIYTQYIFNPLHKINVYAKAGLVTNFVVGGAQNISITYHSATEGVSRGVPISYEENGVKTISLRKTYYNVHGGAGLIAGKHKLEFTYYTPGVLNVPYKLKLKMMGVHYFFTIIRRGER